MLFNAPDWSAHAPAAFAGNGVSVIAVRRDVSERSSCMAIEKTPGGTYGGRAMPSFMARLMVPLMIRLHRRGGDHFQDMDILYLGTTGAKSGKPRTTPVARIADGD